MIAAKMGDPKFVKKLGTWLEKGRVTHRTSHVTPLDRVKVGAAERRLGQQGREPREEVS